MDLCNQFAVLKFPYLNSAPRPFHCAYAVCPFKRMSVCPQVRLSYLSCYLCFSLCKEEGGENPLWAVRTPGRTGCVRLARTKNPLKQRRLPLARRQLQLHLKRPEGTRGAKGA
ncbi:hypothetical protein EVAR_46098_1 [Eumeta japonica]|uniref:Uncharacterized protein n=1 Tax=Eumeta variegata TaxID=151549 RepID=A0A4C1XIK6_EUMVA|nr:hypothetical protein EVAR_46098_1 [Eumeta japonica]